MPFPTSLSGQTESSNLLISDWEKKILLLSFQDCQGMIKISQGAVMKVQ